MAASLLGMSRSRLAAESCSAIAATPRFSPASKSRCLNASMKRRADRFLTRGSTESEYFFETSSSISFSFLAIRMKIPWISEWRAARIAASSTLLPL